MTYIDEILISIETFCAEHDIGESRFGRDVLNDSGFVKRLREGRHSPTLRTIEKIRNHIANHSRATA